MAVTNFKRKEITTMKKTMITIININDDIRRAWPADADPAVVVMPVRRIDKLQLIDGSSQNKNQNQINIEIFEPRLQLKSTVIL